MSKNLKKIKALRTNKKLTQKEVADYLEISTRAYCNYENGARKLPVKHLMKLSKLYEVPVEEIVKIVQ